MPELTPMMQQYTQIKNQHQDALLFYRLGDFFEMFGEDARVASRELDLTLTTRDRSKGNAEDKIPMCGVPFHAVESYIAKLIAKGYKVAICEQMEDPATAKGLVDRDIIRIITPGTVIESSMLDEAKPNYLGAVYIDDRAIAVAFAELSTGEMRVSMMELDDMDRLYSELSTFAPAEVILNQGAYDDVRLDAFLHNRLSCMTERLPERFELNAAAAAMREQFTDGSADSLSPTDTAAAVCAVGALLSYMRDTQKTDLSYMNKLIIDVDGDVMEMDYTTLRNLELVETMSRRERYGSLLWVLDKAQTSMGRRLLRAWLLHPLLDVGRINSRQEAVAELLENTVLRSELISVLHGCGDIERINTKIAYGTANGRDLKALALATERLPEVCRLLRPMKSRLLQEIADMDTLDDIFVRINATIVDDAPFSVREGKIVKAGMNSELDRLRSLLENSSEALAEIERKERERTGKKLKIGFNRVFGYYIEIPRSMSSDVPPDYVRKQTLTNCERFITVELKDLEDTLLTAKEKIATLEYAIFNDLRLYVAAQVGRVHLSSDYTALLDTLCSLAATAAENHYCRPQVDNSDGIDIVNGRHPVVELTQTDGAFVPNDTHINADAQRISIITGPNMAGKSTYMRQTALIVLLAQMGSFVPADSAHIGVVDRVFTRIGASDDLSGGRSTFMVEMTEVAEILKYSTPRSLVLLDEIGRGTSTYDGMAVARAVIEYFLPKAHAAKVLFATHYHELASMEQELENVKNYHITAKKHGNELIFLRTIERGCADDSYGIEVAALAGVPKSVTDRARDILSSFRTDEPDKRMLLAQMSIFDAPPEPDERTQKLLDAVSGAHIENMTPMQALNLLYELQRMLKNEQK